METIKFYTLDEVKDKHIGKVGTPHRDKYEAELQSFLIGEAIKKARKSQNMTQEELAQKIGVQRPVVRVRVRRCIVRVRISETAVRIRVVARPQNTTARGIVHLLCFKELYFQNLQYLKRPPSPLL